MTGSQTIDLIVMKNDCDIHIGATSGDKVGHAFAEQTPIPTDNYYFLSVICQLDTGGGRNGAAM